LLQEPLQKIGEPTGAWAEDAAAHSAKKIFEKMLKSLVMDQDGNCAIDDLKQFIPKVDYTGIVKGNVTVEVPEFDSSKIAPEFQACLEGMKELIANIKTIVTEKLVPLGEEVQKFIMLIAEKAGDLEAVKANLEAEFTGFGMAKIPQAILAVKHNVSAAPGLKATFQVAIENIKHILEGLLQGFKEGIEYIYKKREEIAQKAVDTAKEVVEDEIQAAKDGVVEGVADEYGDAAGEVAGAGVEMVAQGVATGADAAILAANGLKADKVAAIMKVMEGDYDYGHLNEIESEKEAKDIAVAAGLKGNFQKNFLAAYKAAKAGPAVTAQAGTADITLKVAE